ncbi:MAG: ABC transporter permease [Burkholderiales bacterium]|nr:ABC transporter permease [Burkholderiales bacterium]
MSAATRMLLRDLWHLRGQVLAAALVAACGIAALTATRSTWHSLAATQADYYASLRFADAFVRLKRAPEAVAAELREIPGVAEVRTRVVMDVTLDVPGLAEPATGRLVSLPARSAGMLNGVHIAAGRAPEPGRADEVLASQAFAEANGLAIGARIGAILNGRWRELVIVGLGLSPEYIYEVGRGALFPDNRRFGILWMAREAMGPAFDMDGAFNDAVFALAAGSVEAEVLARIDRVVARYGGLAAHGREEQASHRFLSDELGEIRIMATFIPTLFLAVAAFLLYVTLSRLVALQRAQIGLLKAFGRSNASVGAYYLQFALATVGLGLAVGAPLGLALGRLLVAVYRDYFHFPRLELVVDGRLLATVAAVSVTAAVAGAFAAMRSALALPPAEAMRPAAPARFRAGFLERAGLARLAGPAGRMLLRNLARRPGRALLSIAGIALAVGLMLAGRFTYDAVNHLLMVHFDHAQRDDAAVLFDAALPARAMHDIARLPGVRQAEAFRAAPARLTHGARSKRVEITGLPPDAVLRRPVGRDLAVATLPPEGLVLGAKLAQILEVAPGMAVEVEILEGARVAARVAVVATVEELLGLNAYMDAGALARLLREEGTISGAYLRVDPAAADALYAALKRVPAVAGVAIRGVMQRAIRDTMDRSFVVFSAVLVAFASVIVAGMVYNGARIALSERGHELASLRVLGFGHGDIMAIFVGEQALLTLLAIPAGLAIGYGLCALLVPVFDREMFRLPLVIAGTTWLTPVVAALAAATLSALAVARRLRTLDLVAVLKTRE